MVPISPKMIRTKTGLFGAGEDHPYRAEMSPSEVALQIEHAEPASTLLSACKSLAGCWVPGQQRGWGEEEDDEGAGCPCLAHLANTSPIQIQSGPFQGLQEGRKSSSGTVHIPLYNQGGGGKTYRHRFGDKWWAALWDVLGRGWGCSQQDRRDTGFHLVFFLLPAELASFAGRVLACSGVDCCTGFSS